MKKSLVLKGMVAAMLSLTPLALAGEGAGTPANTNANAGSAVIGPNNCTQPGIPQVAHLDAASLAFYSGVVTAVSAAPGAGYPAFTLVLADRTQVTIQTGPYWLFDAGAFAIALGDSLSVAAFKALDPAVSLLFAATIQNLATQQTLELRDTSGAPLWVGSRRPANQFQANAAGYGGDCAPNSPAGAPSWSGQGQGVVHLDLATLVEIAGTVSSVHFVLGARSSYFVLRSDAGVDYRVACGPLWFMSANAFAVAAGERVKAKIASSPDDPAHWAAFEIVNETSADAIVLRDLAGMPLWQKAD